MCRRSIGSSRQTGTQALQSPLVSTGNKRGTLGSLTCYTNSLIDAALVCVDGACWKFSFSHTLMFYHLGVTR